MYTQLGVVRQPLISSGNKTFESLSGLGYLPWVVRETRRGSRMSIALSTTLHPSFADAVDRTRAESVGRIGVWGAN